jgi:twitching motility protein PilT
MKYALRQDPDVIMVSELRDMETIQAAITAAETGHLVLGTLHTIDAPRSLDRLIDVFPSNQQSQIIAQLANCLRAVVSQRLIKTEKSDTRVLVEEVMIVNHPIRNCIRERKLEQIDGLIEIGAKDGMFTIDHHLCELIRKDKISVDEAYATSRDSTVIDSYLEERRRREGG